MLGYQSVAAVWIVADNYGLYVSGQIFLQLLAANFPLIGIIYTVKPILKRLFATQFSSPLFG
jgi:hypothetical protein